MYLSVHTPYTQDGKLSSWIFTNADTSGIVSRIVMLFCSTISHLKSKCAEYVLYARKNVCITVNVHCTMYIVHAMLDVPPLDLYLQWCAVMRNGNLL